MKTNLKNSIPKFNLTSGRFAELWKIRFPISVMLNVLFFWHIFLGPSEGPEPIKEMIFVGDSHASDGELPGLISRMTGIKIINKSESGRSFRAALGLRSHTLPTIVLLGTNFCKDTVSAGIYLDILAKETNGRFWVVSPPDTKLEDKGMADYLQGAAKKRGAGFIDLHKYTEAWHTTAFMHKDGVHLTPAGRLAAAKFISDNFLLK